MALASKGLWAAPHYSFHVTPQLALTHVYAVESGRR